LEKIAVVAIWIRALIAALAIGATASAANAQTPASASSAGVAQRAVVDRYCVTCHNERNKANAGRLDLATIDLSQPAKHAEVLEKAVAKLRAGLMPPAGQRRPAAREQSSLIAYLETALDRAAEASPNPGRTEAFHRLNRAEYRNAVRDLLDVEMDVTPFLPSDDASFGFDNIAGVLKISQSRLEQYLAAAAKISRVAIGSPVSAPDSHVYRVPETTNQYDRLDGLPFGTRGGIRVRHEFPQDGEYELAIDLLCRLGGECDGSVGFADEHRMLMFIDGAQVASFTLEPRKEFRAPADRVWRVRVPVRAGPHEVIATFEKLPSIHEIDSAYERFQRPYFLNGVIGGPSHTIYQPFIDAVTIGGPFNATGPGRTPSRQRIFVCQASTESCAKTIVRALARRAFRRPVTETDLMPLIAMYRRGAADGGFEGGIDAALQWLLVSPEFLYRIARDPAGAAPGTNYRVSDIELASRLSFFLWSSIPDEGLLAAAERGRLKDPEVLRQQVRRMLADRRADALIENFAGQWLLLRNLEAQRPDLPLFPDFDDTLRYAARRETELLFGVVLRENRSVQELLTADYTFVNERLARHYGIAGIYGNEFRRVKLADGRRRGILGHASILTVTSRPNRTSPVLRGKWILGNVLGTPAPEPPADVPALPENETGTKATVRTVRERMLAHRMNPVCSGCHAMLEPPGFALENFDAVGKWRDIDESMAPVDASGAMPDGTKFAGLNDFRAALMKDPDVFATTVTKRLLTYALGRGPEPYDMAAVRRIVRDAKRGGMKLSDIVIGIAQSVPFQMRRTADAGQKDRQP
jgi:mono/diheme cytochrome c family protein